MSEEAVSKRGQENMSNNFLWSRKRRLEMLGLRSQGDSKRPEKIRFRKWSMCRKGVRLRPHL